MSERQNVICWLDPGSTTGLAWWDPESDRFFSGQYEVFQLHEALEDLSAKTTGRLSVGYEQYIVTPRSPGTSEYSQGVIGEVTRMARSGSFELLKPVPSSSRKIATPVFLKRLGWYKPGQGHANDASQHLLAYLMRQRPMPSHIKHKLFPGYNTDATIAV